MIDPSRFSH